MYLNNLSHSCKINLKNKALYQNLKNQRQMNVVAVVVAALAFGTLIVNKERLG
jgi:hypothetical protein